MFKTRDSYIFLVLTYSYRLLSSLQHCNDDVHNCQSDMNIMGAWKRGYTGKDVVVTILDDGIERNHPDLLQNYVSVYVCARRATMSVSVCVFVGCLQ